MRHALREVARCCIHGVDRNPMAVELTKVAPWIETMEPGKPLGFLDASIRCGDALFGVFDLAVLGVGIPDEAYKPLSGDDKETAKHFAARMQLHLDEISRHVAPGAHAVLLMDRAGWHTTTNLDVPDNVTPIFLPSRAPELNPVENIWQYLRANWLSNRVFETYDDIVDAACQAWRNLIAQPQTITSIGMRQWAHVGQSL
jgi:transposase